MGTRRAIVLLVGCIFLTWSCGGDDGNGNETGNCEFSTCGGDIVGTWRIVDLCIDNPDQIFSLTGLPSQCSDIVGDVDYHPDGEFIFGEDGTGEADVIFTVDVEMTLTERCVSAMAGQEVSLSPTICSAMEGAWEGESKFQGGSCEATSNACTCLVTSNEESVASGGDYQVKGDQITSSDSSSAQPFCVTGNRLQIRGEYKGVVMVMTLEKN
jgi:hypothetical protein